MEKSKKRGVSDSVKRPRTRGSAIVELTLLAPWILFLFVGIVDCGFYFVTLISVENAARVGAEYTSKSSSKAADLTGACSAIRSDLAALPGVSGLSNCNSLPLVVTATSLTGADSSPASEVTVQYQTNQLIPIPGLLTGRLTVRRVVQMRVKP